MCHYEVKGCISTIVFNGNITILWFLVQTSLPIYLNVDPGVRKCGMAWKHTIQWNKKACGF